MPITLIADALAELPEPLQKVAKEAGGKFTVSALPDGFTVDDTAGLRRALANEKSARRLMHDKLGEFGWRLSEDGTKWTAEGLPARDATEAFEAKKAGALKSSKEIEDFKAQLAAQNEAASKKAADEKARLRQQLEQVLIDQAATAALSKAGGAKSLRALLPIVKSAARVEESADGSLRVVLYGADGRQRFSQRSGANGASMDLEEFAEELRGSQDLRVLFEAKATGGSGGASQSGGSAPTGGVDLTNLSGASLLAMANEGKK